MLWMNHKKIKSKLKHLASRWCICSRRIEKNSSSYLGYGDSAPTKRGKLFSWVFSFHLGHPWKRGKRERPLTGIAQWGKSIIGVNIRSYFCYSKFYKRNMLAKSFCWQKKDVNNLCSPHIWNAINSSSLITPSRQRYKSIE